MNTLDSTLVVMKIASISTSSIQDLTLSNVQSTLIMIDHNRLAQIVSGSSPDDLCLTVRDKRNPAQIQFYVSDEYDYSEVS